MDAFLDIIAKISGWLWGLPLILLLGLGGIYLTIRMGFFQFKYAGYILKQTFGSIFKESKGEGTVTPFQALTAALASTVGAANIVGVPAAIMFGGPGAIFWMWFIAVMGMASKFTETTLAIKYREKNDEGEFVGGPMYYITKGLNMKWLGVWFAAGLMFEIIPSTMVQANSVASSAFEAWNLSPVISGLIMMVLVGLVVIGGIKRIGKFAEKFVPFMATLYVGAALIILFMNLGKVPEVLGLIFGHAFQPMAPVGGFVGAAVAAAVRWGFARGVYSNEAGLGTAPIAHAAATTDHPVRQGIWAMSGIIIDTLIICSATAFVVLSTDVWKQPGAIDNPSALTAQAFALNFGSIGSNLVTLSLVFFVISTVITLVYYGEKQAEFLFGTKGGKIMKYVYVLSVFVGALGGGRILWQFLDISLAAIVIPNMIAILLLSGEVKKLKDEFFTSEDYYLKDINETTTSV